MAQRPLPSGFGARSTADEVLAGIDLTGRYAVVTGGYSGIGLETSRALAAHGADVLVPARRPEHATDELAAAGVPAAVAPLDLGDLASVRAFGEELLAEGRRVDLLINNAGIMACPEARIGDGWESQFATNHLGHHVLANRIWPLLADGGARVVALSSSAHKLSPIRFEDPMFTAGDYQKWVAYGQAKTANALFAVELDRLGRDAGVRAFAVHPGGIATPLQRHLTLEEMRGMGWLKDDDTPIDRFKSVPQGAATTCWAATSPQLDGLGGLFCEDADVAPINEPDAPDGRVRGVASYAVDPDAARRLWALSAQLTEEDAFAPAQSA